MTDRDLRVLHLDHSTARGGAEYALMRILRVEHDWKATVALPRPSDDDLGVFSALREHRNVPLAVIGPAQSPGASRAGVIGSLRFGTLLLAQSASLRRSRAFAEADLIHTNTSRAAIYGAIACLGTNKRLVVHLRDMVSADALGSIGLRPFTGVALRRADGVISDSQSTLDSAQRHLEKETSTAVIPSAMGLERLVSRGDSRIDDTVRRVAMVARISPWKGQELLLRAFATAFRDSEAELVFAGSAEFADTDYLETLRRLALQLGVADRTIFAGHVEDVTGFLGTVDICVQASTRPEPLGQNVLQYLAAGRPAVVTRQGGPGEWVEDGRNGLLFEMGDTADLARALSTLRTDTALRRRFAATAASTPGLADDTEIAQRHGDYFRDVMASSGSTRG